MKQMKVGVIDYGMGNLHSVAKALALQGGDVTVSADTDVLSRSQLLVLPGVGSFGAACDNLTKRGLDRFVQNWIQEDRPYLGICLGFQLLFEESEEDPGAQGLGVFPGRVVRFQPNGSGLKVPHMGWNTLQKNSANKASYLNGISAEDYFYFVHTFYPAPTSNEDVLTETQYGQPFCSSVARGNLFASQFHPEKSGDVGLRLLSNIVKSVHSA